MRTERGWLLAVLLAAGLPSVAAGESSDAERLEALERRVEELEAAEAERASDDGAWLDDWAERVRLGGYASAGYFHRGALSSEDSNAFQIWDARLFLDVELARDVRVGDTTLLRSVGASLEWEFVRLGSLENQLGELYVDFQGIGDCSWLNAQVGRFQIPVGENYLRFGKGHRDDPFITGTVGGPWWWDEGVRLYGSGFDGWLGYVASVSNGETDLNADDNGDPQGTLKLTSDPFPWLHLSVSGLLSGGIGSSNSMASGALWLGETWAIPIGAFTAVPTISDGAPVVDGPNEIDRTWLLGADAVLTPLDGLRIWLGGGRYGMEASGSGPYDRQLDFWIAEVVASGRLISRRLDALYLGARANGLTTGDDDRGYALDVRMVDELGFNVKSLAEYSAVLGVHVGRFVRLRGEYTFQDIDLVRGVPSSVSSQRGDEHWFAVDVSVAF